MEELKQTIAALNNRVEKLKRNKSDLTRYVEVGDGMGKCEKEDRSCKFHENKAATAESKVEQLMQENESCRGKMAKLQGKIEILQRESSTTIDQLTEQNESLKMVSVQCDSILW